MSTASSTTLMRMKIFRASKLGKIAVSVGLKIFGAVIAFIWQLCTIRILGPLAGGLVAVAQSQMRLIGTTGAFGQDRSLSLSLPIAGSHEDIRRRLKQAQTSGLITTFVILAGSLLFLVCVRGVSQDFTIILTGVGALTFCLLVGAAGAARGLHAPLNADFGFTVLPLSISSIVFCAFGTLYGWTAGLAMVALVIGQAVALLYFRIVLVRSMRAFKADTASRPISNDLRTASARGIDQLAIAVCTTFSAMYPDALLIIVGYASSSASAAAFGIAVRYIRLARFVPVSFLHVREPHLAQMWKDRDIDRLAGEIRVIAAFSFFVSLGVLLPLLLFAPTLLGIFGSEFRSYSSVLRLVALAELVNSVALMPTSMLLVGGRSRTLAAITTSVYFGGLLVSGFAIHRYGGDGAAVVVVITNAFLAVITSMFCFKLIGVRSDAMTACVALIAEKSRPTSNVR